MKVKQLYESPQILEYSFRSEGMICTSGQVLNSGDPLQEMEIETFTW